MIQGIPVPRTPVYCHSLLFFPLGALQMRVVICPTLIRDSCSWGLGSAVLKQKSPHGSVFSCSNSADHQVSRFGSRMSQVMHHRLGRLLCRSSCQAVQKCFVSSKPKASENRDVGFKTSEIKIKAMLVSSRFVCWNGVGLSFPTVRKERCSLDENKS